MWNRNLSRTRKTRWIAVGVVLLLGRPATIQAADVLVADRLSDSVYRYSANGDFLNVVLSEVDAQPEDDYVSQPTGLALSPDGTQLYVSSSQTDTVVRYDYESATGLASNPFVFADQQDGLSFPNSILFSPDGATVYVSNLGGTGVARFNLDGSSAGAPLGAFDNGAYSEFSGLAWTPTGELLVNGFLNSVTGAGGAVGKSDAAVATLESFIGPSASLVGASGLLIHDDHAYVTGMFAGNLQRFDLESGLPDATFSVTGLPFPQGLMVSPDGNGLLVGILGYANGAGQIAHYDFEGNLVGDGVFAAPGGGGFAEATVFIPVPDLPGDFNGDRLVDATDLAAWATHFGDESGEATLAMGDADGNGTVDGADFLLWQRHAKLALTTATLAVPEPASLLLIAFALVPLLGRRRSAAETTS